MVTKWSSSTAVLHASVMLIVVTKWSPSTVVLHASVMLIVVTEYCGATCICDADNDPKKVSSCGAAARGQPTY